MRIFPLMLLLAVVPFGRASAAGSFIVVQTPGVQITKISGNGVYATGSTPGPGWTGSASQGFRWTAATGAEELFEDFESHGVNDAGTITAVFATFDDRAGTAAYAPVGAAPVPLTNPLADMVFYPYGIANNDTFVGMALKEDYSVVQAFVWTPAEGMSVLPVNRPQNYSRPNDISADGRVIVGWNDQDTGGRTAVIWRDREPLDVVDAAGVPVGEAISVSPNGRFVVGVDQVRLNDAGTDIILSGWRWSAEEGVLAIPDMPNAFAVTDDGKTIVGMAGRNGPYESQTALIWREGIGLARLADYLAEKGIALPEGWDPNLLGAPTAISGDGRLIGGWVFGAGTNAPPGSYLIRLDADDLLFSDGFDESQASGR